jgi:acetyltransferase-like isoleucine patch superfamily enzyme
MPGIKVGVNSWVGPNLTVTRDLPSNTIVLAKQNVESRSF